MIYLGYSDELITPDYANQVDFTTNKIGGYPDWIYSDSFEEVKCRVCGDISLLLVQVYAPIKERTDYHRTLYVFVCINKSCWGNCDSWRCIKEQKQYKENISEGKSSVLTDGVVSDNWCTNANDSDVSDNWCTESDDWDIKTTPLTVDIEQTANIFSHVSINEQVFNYENDVKSMKQKTDSKLHFKPQFIFVEEETLYRTDPMDARVQKLINEYKKNNNDYFDDIPDFNSRKKFNESVEHYEKSTPIHGDKLYHAFINRIKKNPHQIIRYSRDNSSPLFLYQEHIPKKCKYCKGEMIFEFQILPIILSNLKFSDPNLNVNDYLEFGSVYIYTCKRSCDESIHEAVLIQMENLKMK